MSKCLEESAIDNSSSTNCSQPFANLKHYLALVPLLVPALALFGNLLVMYSVIRFRFLHNPVNYFVFGLALADLMVSLIVMPFAVYVEFNDGVWQLGAFMCDLYCAADVTCSTASIFLLTVISFDRYMAATHPINYIKNKKTVLQVTGINIGVWFVSLLIASPMVLGLNNVIDRDVKNCRFYNADFIIYSSIGSFCIPLFLMIYLYARIYKVIRERSRINKAQQSRKFTMVAQRSSKQSIPPSQRYKVNGERLSGNSHQTLSQPVSEAKEAATLKKSLSMQNLQPEAETLFEIKKAATLDNLKRNQRKTGLSGTVFNQSVLLSPKRADDISRSCSYAGISKIHASFRRRTVSTTHRVPEIVFEALNMDGIWDTVSYKSQPLSQVSFDLYEDSDTNDSSMSSAIILDDAKVIEVLNSMEETISLKNMSPTGQQAARRATLKVNSDLNGSLTTFVQKRKISRKVYRSTKRERKATKTLAIVLGVFLFCWMPFFTLNLMNALCMKLNVSECQITFYPFFVTTWLGYVNSVVNPIIYTVFNLEFRKAFKLILCQWRESAKVTQNTRGL